MNRSLIEPNRAGTVVWLWPSRRALALDLAIAAAVVYFDVVGAVFGPPGPLLPGRWAGVALAALGGLSLLLRRRFPLAVGLLAVVIGVLVTTVPLLVAVALYTAASRARTRPEYAAAAGLLALAVLLVGLSFRRSGLAWVLEFSTILFGFPAAAGFFVGARRVILERQRHLLAERARTEERSRIAREMHDLVAHQVSLIVLQAGALEVNPGLSRQQVGDIAGLIRSLGSGALVELRQVVAALRTDGQQEAPLLPQARLEDLGPLI